MARKSRMPAITTYLQSNADRILTVQEIATATGAPLASVSGVARTLVQRDPHVEAVARGMYRYNSKAGSVKKGDCLVVEVIRDDDDKRLVHDEHGILWKMQRLTDY